MKIFEQYHKLKKEYPTGTILSFKVGDFYEFFFEDATLTAKVLGLTLTTRDKASTNPVPMTGFPYHQLDNYLQRLLEAGHRVAVCEQVS